MFAIIYIMLCIYLLYDIYLNTRGISLYRKGHVFSVGGVSMPKGLYDGCVGHNRCTTSHLDEKEISVSFVENSMIVEEKR